MPEENKYANLPQSMMPLVRSLVLERIKALEGVVEAHKKSIDEALKPVMEQIEEANTDLKWINDEMEGQT